MWHLQHKDRHQSGEVLQGYRVTSYSRDWGSGMYRCPLITSCVYVVTEEASNFPYIDNIAVQALNFSLLCNWDSHFVVCFYSVTATCCPNTVCTISLQMQRYMYWQDSWVSQNECIWCSCFHPCFEFISRNKIADLKSHIITYELSLVLAMPTPSSKQT